MAVARYGPRRQTSTNDSAEEIFFFGTVAQISMFACARGATRRRRRRIHAAARRGSTWRATTTRGRTSPPCSTARSRARALLRWDWGEERQRAVSERDRADVSSARADASEDRRTVSKRAKKRALGKGSDGWDADGRAPLEARAAAARPPRATTVAWGLVATANMVRSCRCGRRTRPQSLLLGAKSR